MEFIGQTQVSPLITKGVCKVCYVGQEANRNGTVITKELATDMGRNLPGSPVVGCYNKNAEDFGGHDREIVLQGGSFEILDMTKPYGFVPTDANVWFQKFDDDGAEHEYLVTDVYIWTETYPESKRIFDKGGNNQSMELNGDSINGYWTSENTDGNLVFIYTEALIEKLCILGQDVEPCFEGAQIKENFSLEEVPGFNEFKTKVFSMMNELQETLNKGGSQEPMDNDKKLTSQYAASEEDDEKKKQEQAKKEEEKKKKEPSNDNSCGNKKKDYEEDNKKKTEDDDEKKEDKKAYSLDEIPEYVELQGKYAELQNNYADLQKEKDALSAEIVGLREFKMTTERANKQAMIDSFYMLSEEDKKDVTEHIDTYSLDDIEAKLSIICVRNKVSFNMDDTNKTNDVPSGLFSLEDAAKAQNADEPAWLSLVREKNG